MTVATRSPVHTQPASLSPGRRSSLHSRCDDGSARSPTHRPRFPTACAFHCRARHACISHSRPFHALAILRCWHWPMPPLHCPRHAGLQLKWVMGVRPRLIWRRLMNSWKSSWTCSFRPRALRSRHSIVPPTKILRPPALGLSSSRSCFRLIFFVWSPLASAASQDKLVRGG